MLIRARAPVRIDFAGGWTDVALFAEESKGIVVNAAISIYSYATVVYSRKKNDAETIELRRVLDQSIRIYSADFDTFIQAEDIRKLEYDGNIDLLKAALRRMSLEDGGFDLITQSIAPSGSGLGTSAAMGVALVGVLGETKQTPLLPYECAELASSIEKHELGILGGKQDHYASAIGGVNFMEFMGEEVKTSSLRMDRDVCYELEKNLVLCYTGKSRLSGNIHQNVTGAYQSGEKETRSALRRLREIAREVKNNLIRGQLGNFGQLLTENWESQKTLHPSVSNENLERFFDLAMSHGAIGGKACGAGGGGCLLFYCKPDQEHCVRQTLESAGAEIIDFNFDFAGLRTWRTKSEK